MSVLVVHGRCEFCIRLHKTVLQTATEAAASAKRKKVVFSWERLATNTGNRAKKRLEMEIYYILHTFFAFLFFVPIVGYFRVRNSFRLFFTRMRLPL